MLTSPTQGYRARLTSSLSSDEPRHRFCGPQAFAGALCPNCRRPLHAFVTLDTTDTRLSLAESPIGAFLPLLWCWSCPCAQAPFTYAVHQGSVSLLHYRKGRRTPDFPYDGYPDFFPGSGIRLVPVSTRTASLIKAVHDGASTYPWRYRRASKPCHQVGGVPYLLQGTDYQDGDSALLCPTCQQPMPLLASIANRALDPRGLCGTDYVQVLFHLCRAHATVTAIQQCD